MRTLVFTICARNYIGLARVLGGSLSGQSDSPDFRIYVAEGLQDGMAAGEDLVSAPEALSELISPVELANMAFMYNITEFCTAIKAACLLHAFADGYDKVVYLDPDTYVAGEFGPINQTLDECEILITPHLCIPSLEEGPRSDQGILATGVYNLGFIGLRRGPASRRFLSWWHERLRTRAFNDHYGSLFTDQRWVDFVPSLFPAEVVRVWRHLGCNVAPWNFHERRIAEEDRQWLVRPRTSELDASLGAALVFLHFSGFDFRRILKGEFDQRNLPDSKAWPDLTPIFERYAGAIQARAADFEHHLAIPYAFDSFADGSPILPSQRRLFRTWRERHGDAADPFATGPGTFHAALKQRGLLAKSRATDLRADTASIRTVKDADALLRKASLASRLLYRLLGRARFFLVIRSLNRLGRVEQHYDAFNLDAANVVRADLGRSAP
jgi:hypothetical protein